MFYFPGVLIALTWNKLHVCLWTQRHTWKLSAVYVISINTKGKDKYIYVYKCRKVGAKYRCSNIHPCLNSFWLNNIETFKIYITNMCNCHLCVKLKQLSPLSTQRNLWTMRGGMGGTNFHGKIPNFIF